MDNPHDPPASPSRPSAAAPGADVRPARRLRPWIWLVVIAFLGSFALAQIPREIGRWHLAAALKLRDQGQKDPANEQLLAAIAWFPNSPLLLLQRAEWRLEDGQREEAFADCDRMLELGGETPSWLQVHGQFLQNAGEFVRAVADWKKIERFSQRSGIPSRAQALNGLAYAQALAGIELDEALKNVNQSLELMPAETSVSEKKHDSLRAERAAILDTRGWILHLQGHDDQAIVDMDDAVGGIDAKAKGSSGSETDQEAETTPRAKSLADATPQTLRVDPARANAVIHYHRALVLAALDRTEEASAERSRARKLIGREPDETLF